MEKKGSKAPILGTTSSMGTFHDASDHCYVSSYAPIQMSETREITHFFWIGKLPKSEWFIIISRTKKAIGWVSPLADSP